MSKEITQFKYEQLDESTANFLRTKESNMRQIVGKAYTELGRELYEAQQELSKKGGRHEGVFGKWLQYIGMERRQATRLIQRYKLVIGTNCPEGENLIEDLPVSLSYEIAKPSAESTPAKAQAKSEVLAGKIDSLKEYRDRIKELERKAEQAEQEADIQRKLSERLAQEKEQAEQDAQSAREELERALEEANPFSEEPYGVKLGLAMYDAFEELSKWQKEYSWILTDATEFQKLVEADPNFAREFSRLDKFWKQMSAAFNGVRSKGTYREETEATEIIDVEFTEVI